MNSCPTPEELVRLLDQDGPDASDFEAHLEGCAECLRAVEALVADGPAIPLVSLRPTVVAHEGFLRRPLRFSSGAGPPSDVPLPQVAGYEVLGELGRGGMGVVYRARHVRLDRVVALKMILGGEYAGEDEKRRFLNEAAAIAQVKHPGIVQVYDYGTHEGLPYFSLEFCEGGSLAERLVGTTLPAGAAATLIEQLARAMQAAHDAGVVHRDLKPENVLLSEPRPLGSGVAPPLPNGRGSDGVAKITDFGLAKRVEGGGQTRTSAVMGTPSYMAPEQTVGQKDVGPLTDVWALGAILYECLTGRPPFKAANLLETLLQVKTEEPVAVRQLQAKVPRDLETICHKCLQKDPQNRYASASALADDLRRYLDGRPILARPVGRIERLWRWGQREPALAGLLATVLVALVGLSLGLLVVGGLNRRLGTANMGLDAALADAEDKRSEAEKERNIAVAVNDLLLKDLLGQADIVNQPFPGAKEGRDRNITVAQLLDRAAKEVEGKFQDQPETEAAIRRTIGNAYRALGKYELAQPQLERSLAVGEKKLGADHIDTLMSKSSLAGLYYAQRKHDQAEALYLVVIGQQEKKLGKDHLDTLTSKHNLAELYRTQGKHDQAEPLFLEVLALEEKKLGADHQDTLISKHNLAALYYALGKYDQAEPLYLEVIKQQDKKLGADHPHTLFSKNNLATLYHSQGKLDQAEPLYLEVIKQQEKNLRADHPDTLTSKGNLAALYYTQRKYDQAEPLYLEVIGQKVKNLGADHPDTLISKHNLAALYQAQGKFNKAEPLYLVTLEQQVKKLGADHADTLSTKHSLAGLYQAQGKLNQAEPLYLEVIGQKVKNLGKDHPSTVTSKHNLASLYKAQGKHDQAEPLFLEVIEQQENRRGADHADTLSSKHSLAQVYQAQGKFDQAEPLFLEVLGQLEKQRGADHPHTLISKNNLASLYKAQRKFAQAEPLSQQAVKGATRSFGFAHPNTQTFFRNLVDLYERWSKPEKGEPLLRQRLDFLQSQAGAESPDTAAAMAQLGTNLLLQKKYAEAEKLLRDGLRIREKIEPDLWTTFHSRSVLGEALVGLKKYADAEPLLVQGYEGLEKRAAKMPPQVRPDRLKQALERLVLLYDATGNQAEAAKWRKQLDAATKASGSKKSVP